MLEDTVDEKYYLSETMLQGFIAHNQNHNAKGTGFTWQPRDLEGNASYLRANAALSATDNTLQVLGNLKGESGHHGHNIYKDSGISPTLLSRDFKDPTKVAESKIDIVGYLSEGYKQINYVLNPNGISKCLDTMGGGNREPKVMCLNTKDENGKQPSQQARVYDIDGLMTTLMAEQNGRFNIAEPQILQAPRGFNKGALLDDCPTITSNSWECNNFAVEPSTKYVNVTDNAIEIRRKTSDGDFGIQGQRANFENGFLDTISTSHCGNVIELPTICSSRGRNPDNPSDRTVGVTLEQRLELNTQGTSNTLTSVQKDNWLLDIDFRIRKLTPKECWRLMGFTDEDYYRAKYFSKRVSEDLLKQYPNHKGKRQLTHEQRIERMSDSQMYKQAGNSIVVKVLYYMYYNLFIEKDIPQDCDVQIKLF